MVYVHIKYMFRRKYLAKCKRTFCNTFVNCFGNTPIGIVFTANIFNLNFQMSEKNFVPSTEPGYDFISIQFYQIHNYQKRHQVGNTNDDVVLFTIRTQIKQLNYCINMWME